MLQAANSKCRTDGETVLAQAKARQSHSQRYTAVEPEPETQPQPMSDPQPKLITIDTSKASAIAKAKSKANATATAKAQARQDAWLGLWQDCLTRLSKLTPSVLPGGKDDPERNEELGKLLAAFNLAGCLDGSLPVGRKKDQGVHE